MIKYSLTLEKHLAIIFATKLLFEPLIGPISGLMIAAMTSEHVAVMPWKSFTSAMVGRY